jgi:positive phototaxis protein PixI
MDVSPKVTLPLTSLDLLETDPVAQVDQEKFLHFALTPTDSALLPMKGVVEVLRVPMTDVLPVPYLPSCVLGIYNRRGEMLWLIDLAHLIGYPVRLQPGSVLVTGTVIVLEVNQQLLGLAVSQVYDIEGYDPQQLKSPSAQLFSPQLLPFVQGYFDQASSTVLDAVAIAQSPLIQLPALVHS